jgi:hypothetical protein
LDGREATRYRIQSLFGHGITRIVSKQRFSTTRPLRAFALDSDPNQKNGTIAGNEARAAAAIFCYLLGFVLLVTNLVFLPGMEL